MGIPAATICTRPFETMASAERRALGLPNLPVIVIGHPLGGLRLEAVRERVTEAADALATLLAEP